MDNVLDGDEQLAGVAADQRDVLFRCRHFAAPLRLEERQALAVLGLRENRASGRPTPRDRPAGSRRGPMTILGAGDTDHGLLDAGERADVLAHVGSSS
jgi:hypothetical protein